MYMASLDRMTWDKIDKYFDDERTLSSLKYAGERLKKEIDDYAQERCDRFADYLQDEFRLLFADLVQSEVKKVVQYLLQGDVKALEEYNLAPADWGLRCDTLGIRRKIVEDNADIIRSTYLQSLEEELKRTKEMLEISRGYR